MAWLALGAVVTVAGYWPSAHAVFAAAGGPGSAGWTGAWARGVLAGARSSEPVGQAVLDYLFSVVNLAIAAALWWHGRRDRTARLLTVAMVGSAAAFNLQAHADISVVEAAFRVPAAVWWVVLVLLHGVGGVAYVVALTLFPTGRWDIGGPARWLAGAAVGGCVAGAPALLAFSAGGHPHPLTFVVFFGTVTPLVGLVAQRHRARHGSTLDVRRQSRLLFTALTMALTLAVVLGAVTVALSWLHVPGLTLYAPMTSDAGSLYEPTALVFWFVRLVFAAIPCALLIVAARTWSWKVERFFGRGLAYPLITVLLGTVFLVLVAGINAIFAGGGGVLAVGLAVLAVAVLFQPLRIQVERLLDRLVYGSTPVPYAVLARVADLSRAAETDHPDLAALAEAVAGGLDASFCRITLRLPDLGDRHHQWPAGAALPAEHVTFPLLHNGERVGAMTVDRTSVTRLTGDRRRLVDDLAGVLGPVLRNSRLGVELADQLRKARRRSEAIAASRRRGVAEMDRERQALERDLHDGAQHHLVALRTAVGLIEHELAHRRPRAARERLGHVVDQVDTTRRVLTDTAAGMFPVTLADRGLLPALAEQFRDVEPAVDLDVDGVVAGRRFPPAVESAVYFACLEAVGNARKHAPGAAVRVRVRAEDRWLAFRITDDGPGFAFGATDLPETHGLHGIGDRTNAVGGTLTVHSAPGAGTTVAGRIPW
ncbi:ATP-binding protein [Gandjariella thermophila]|uniref:ATP-binding protein n=1 Tax=Gandjariella thermophila TaxID=1931992 RepID=UPI0010F95C68|nr:ATP-binding protein [Gandjariella thermophila]